MAFFYGLKKEEKYVSGSDALHWRKKRKPMLNILYYFLKDRDKKKKRHWEW
jgi:hypothetical protein